MAASDDGSLTSWMLGVASVFAPSEPGFGRAGPPHPAQCVLKPLASIDSRYQSALAFGVRTSVS